MIPRLTDWYMGVLAMALVVSALLAGISHALTQRSAELASVGPWLPALVGLLWFAGLLAACVSLGPAAAAPAVRTWIVSTPVDRALALQRRSVTVAASCAGLGAVGGLIISYCAVPQGPSAVLLVAATVYGTVVGLAVHQVALSAQTRRSGRDMVRTSAAAVALLACGSIAVAAHVQLPTAAAKMVTGSLVALGGMVIVFGIATIGRTRDWLRAVTIVDLIEGSDIAAAVAGSVATFDGTPLELRDERRTLARRASYRSARRFGNLYPDLVARDLRDLARRVNLAPRVLMVLTVWALAAVFGAGATIMFGAWLSYSAAATAAVRLRRWLGSSSIWLGFPQTPQAISFCLSLSGLLVATGVAALSTLGSPVPVSFALTVGPAAMAALVRRSYRPPITAGALMSTPAGALPLGLLVSMLYGIDVGAACLVVGAAFGWWIGAVVSLACLVWTLWRAIPGGTRRPVLRRRPLSPGATRAGAASRWDG